MSSASSRWRSIDRTLPLLISGLILGVVAAFMLTAYHRVQRVLLRSAGQRLEAASTPVALLLAQSTAKYRVRLAHAATDPAIVQHLATGRGADAARRALSGLWADEKHPHGHLEILTADRRLAVDTSLGTSPASSAWADRLIRGGTLVPGEPVVGPLTTFGDSSFSVAVVAVPAATNASGAPAPNPHGSHAGPPAGYIVDLRFLSAEGAQTVRDLIGLHATVLLGSLAEGDWTDLEHPAAPPPSGAQPGQPMVFDSSPRGAGVGAATAIDGTPWVVWVEQPRATILAPMHALLMEMLLLASAFVVMGAFGGWVISRRITGPIVALTHAAEALAPADAPSVVQDESRNEVTRLTDSFARMAARVHESHRELEDRVAERTQRLEHALADLEQAQAQLVQKERLAMLGQLASGVGHELRNPLGVMTNALYVLEQCLPDPAPMVREYLGLLRGQIGISERIVGDLLDTARVRPPQVEPVPIRSLVERQLERLGPVNGVEVRLDIPADLPAVTVDPAQIAQILLNLFSNAVQAMGDTGQRTLSIAARQDGKDRVRLSVTDTGPGIAPEVLDRIFEPLFTTKAKGLGLGLWVSMTLARANGAELTVTSRVGQGASFALLMPTSRPPGLPAAHAPVQPSTHAHPAAA